MTESFDADWLHMREPADHAARCTELESKLKATLVANNRNDPSRSGSAPDGSAAMQRYREPEQQQATPLRIVDLGSGRGSNLRHLAPRLSDVAPRQHWTLVDHDEALLAQALAAHRGGLERSEGGVAYWSSDVEVATHRADFSAGAGVLIDALHPRLVTAAALIDLVSAAWLDDLVAACRRNTASILITLTYAGRFAFEATGHPSRAKRGLEGSEGIDATSIRGSSGAASSSIETGTASEIDQQLLAAINAHQRTDKGFGPALGPEAAPTLQQLLADSGYRSLRRASCWRLDATCLDLAAALIDGWIGVTQACTPDVDVTLQRWKAARLEALATGTMQLRVWHDDVLGIVEQ